MKKIILLITVLLSSCTNPFMSDEVAVENPIQVIDNSKTDDVVQLFAPLNIEVVSGGAVSIDLTWDSEGSDISYNVYRSLEELGDYELVSESNEECSYTDLIESEGGTVIVGLMYYYKVTSIDSTGIESAMSSVYAGYATDIPVAQFTVSDELYVDKVSVVIEVFDDVIAYVINRSLSEEGNYTEVYNGDNNIFEDVDVEAGVDYFYKVIIKTLDQTSAESEALIGRVADGTYLAPSELSATTSFQDRIELSWVGTADSYEIYSSDLENGSYEKIGVTEELSYTDNSSNNIDELSHYYRFKAVYANGVSPLSDSVVGSVISEAPVLQLLGDAEITLNTTLNEKWDDPGFTATDNLDGDITSTVLVSGFVEDVVRNIDGYSITYTATDNAGNSSSIERLVKVISTPDLSNAEEVAMLPYLEATKTSIFAINGILNPLTADDSGLEYAWTIDGETVDTTSIAQKAIVGTLGTYNIAVNVSNIDGVSVYDFGETTFYPVCPTITNGGFESAENVAPWLWELDVRVDVLVSYTWYDVTDAPSSNNLGYAGAAYDNENITELGVGNSSEKSAKICNTTYDTNFWSAGDKLETSGTLTSNDFTLVEGATYVVTADVWREDQTDLTTVTLNLGTSTTVAPTTAGWSTVTVEYTPAEEEITNVSFFKGVGATDSDMYEVRFDNVELSYKQ